MRHPALLAIAAPAFAVSALVTCISTARAQQQPPANPQPAIVTSAPADAGAAQDATPKSTVQTRATNDNAISQQEPTAAADTKPATPAGEPAVQQPAEPSAENPAAQAGDPDFRAALDGAVPIEPAAYSTEPYRLRLHNLHTLENIDIVYRIGDTYQPEAVARLNYFLRDHYTNDVVNYDPREFDLLHDIMIRLRRPGATIDVVCGYRTQETNETLRASSQGVAEHSQHILGHAIDIRVPGSTTARLRNAALSLNEGGVGYYPTTHFVHVDVGAIRTWTYAPHPRHRRAKAHHRQIAARRHHTTRAEGM